MELYFSICRLHVNIQKVYFHLVKRIDRQGPPIVLPLFPWVKPYFLTSWSFCHNVLSLFLATVTHFEPISTCPSAPAGLPILALSRSPSFVFCDSYILSALFQHSSWELNRDIALSGTSPGERFWPSKWPSGGPGSLQGLKSPKLTRKRLVWTREFFDQYFLVLGSRRPHSLNPVKIDEYSHCSPYVSLSKTLL